MSTETVISSVRGYGRAELPHPDAFDPEFGRNADGTELGLDELRELAKALGFSREFRERVAALSPEARREMSYMTGFLDGHPFDEGSVRATIRGLRDEIPAERDAALRAVLDPEDIADRCLGSLNPDEIRVVFDQEWPAEVADTEV